MARFFLYGNYHSHPKFKAIYDGLIASGLIVFRAYTYDNEIKYDSYRDLWTPPQSPQFFTESEYAQFRQLEDSSSFCLDKFIDNGRVYEGMIEISEQLCILLKQVDVFVAI